MINTLAEFSISGTVSEVMSVVTTVITYIKSDNLLSFMIAIPLIGGCIGLFRRLF